MPKNCLEAKKSLPRIAAAGVYMYRYNNALCPDRHSKQKRVLPDYSTCTTKDNLIEAHHDEQQ